MNLPPCWRGFTSAERRRKMALPQKSELAGLTACARINTFVGTRKFELTGLSATTWTINGLLFGAECAQDQCPQVDTAEEWTLHSSNDNHPFHVHVNPFQVLSIKDSNNNETLKQPVWKDTILLPQNYTICFRTQFADYPGKTVLHCHKLDHEDYGMMEMFRILAKCYNTAPQPKVVSQRQPLPDLGQAATWGKDITGADGKWHTLAEFKGRPLVLAFYRGKGCPHCVEQLRLISAGNTALEAAGMSVVAIGTDSKNSLIAAQPRMSHEASSPPCCSWPTKVAPCSSNMVALRIIRSTVCL